jgi:hypothetical protein
MIEELLIPPWLQATGEWRAEGSFLAFKLKWVNKWAISPMRWVNSPTKNHDTDDRDLSIVFKIFILNKLETWKDLG